MSVSRWRSTNQQTLCFLHNPTCFKSQKLLMRLVCRIAITKRFSGLSYLLYMWILDSPHFPCAVFLGSNLHCISNLMTSLLLFYADELRTITLKMVLLFCFFLYLTVYISRQISSHISCLFPFQGVSILFYTNKCNAFRNPTWQVVWKMVGWIPCLFNANVLYNLLIATCNQDFHYLVIHTVTRHFCQNYDRDLVSWLSLNRWVLLFGHIQREKKRMEIDIRSNKIQ